MVVRLVLVLCVLAVLVVPTAAGPAYAGLGAPQQTQALAGQEHAASYRAIRRDVPLTNAIRSAMEAGTRDFTGSPGPSYWQLETDYTINVRLDPATQTLTGQETIAMHNNSPDELNQIVLRLDHNIFRATVPRGSSVPAETTEGMVVTRIVVNGETVDLDAPPQRFGRGSTLR